MYCGAANSVSGFFSASADVGAGGVSSGVYASGWAPERSSSIRFLISSPTFHFIAIFYPSKSFTR